MRLICPNCDAHYEVDASAIPESGRDVQCSNCSNMWFVRPEGDVDAAEVAAFMAQNPPTRAAAAVEPPAPVPPVAHAGSRLIRALAPSDETEFEDDEPQTATNLPPPRRALDESVLAVLREEAAREVAARKAEAQAVGRRANDAGAAGYGDAAAPAEQPAAAPASNVAPAADPYRDAPHPEDDDLGAPFEAVQDDGHDARHDDGAPYVEVAAADGGSQDPLPPFAQTVAEGGHPELLGNSPHPAAAPLPDQAEVDALNALLEPPPPLTVGGAPVQPRHALLPDIEEINSTLRPSDEQEDPVLAPKPDDGRRGFRLGYGVMIALGGAVVAAYAFADDLAQIPGMTSWVAAYVNLVDGLRVQLDGLIEQAARYVRGLAG